MITETMLLEQLAAMGIDQRGTLLVHSSMKAIGPVEGGADAVLNALCEYIKDGLLIFPTHTWAQMSPVYTVFDVMREPSCVGVLTNLFRVRPGAVRSLHPTHSVAAIGADAGAYAAGEENTVTPCSPNGCWGRLYDRNASILFIGCDLTKNTFIHCVEEMNHIPNRLADAPQAFTVVDKNGVRHTVWQHRHHCTPPPDEVSQFYGKMEPAFAQCGAIRYGTFGEAKCILGDAVKMADITGEYLKKNPKLFDDATPLSAMK